jgi:hypothetical protein
MISAKTLPRHHKLLMEKAMSASDAAAVVAGASVNVAYDEDAASNRLGQIAVLTVVATAVRAFGNVAFVGPEHELLVRGGPGSTLYRALREAGGHAGAIVAPTIFVASNVNGKPGDLRVTMRRGVGGVAAAESDEPFDLNAYPPATILGASLAVSDMFRRSILGEPDDGRTRSFDLLPRGFEGNVDRLDMALPAEMAFLGVGHLGQAALFAAALLGRVDDVRTYELLDDEEIDPEANFSTQLLLSAGQTGLKTTACASWLRTRGIEPVEKAGRLGVGLPMSFRSKTFLAGFDNPEGRRALDLLLPASIIDAGIGARVGDFTAFRVHVFPQERRPSETFFDPLVTLESVSAAAREKSAFAASARSDEERCGLMDVAGIASGSPFVGTAVAAIVLSEVIRIAVGISPDDIVSGDLRRSDLADVYAASKNAA